jgi:hypothetical protein
MPLGFLVFPQLARGLGYERTLLAAAVVTAATNLVVGLLPGVHAVTEEPVAVHAEPSAA